MDGRCRLACAGLAVQPGMDGLVPGSNGRQAAQYLLLLGLPGLELVRDIAFPQDVRVDDYGCVAVSSHGHHMAKGVRDIDLVRRFIRFRDFPPVARIDV